MPAAPLRRGMEGGKELPKTYYNRPYGSWFCSAGDIYWLLKSLLIRVNKDIDGEFYLRRLKKGAWHIEYRRKIADELKADRRHQRQIDETKKLIKRLKF